MHVDYAWGVDVQWHGLLVLRSLTLEPWPWHWGSCGHSCTQAIDDDVTRVCMWTTQEGSMWTTQEGKMCRDMEFWSFDFWPWSLDFDLGNFVHGTASRVLMPTWPVCTCGLLMRGRCAGAQNLCPVTVDLGSMMFTLRLLWTLLFPWGWCQRSQYVHGDYSWGIGAYGYNFVVLWPLALMIWSWPFVLYSKGSRQYHQGQRS